jgi:hypothetical protein
MSPSFFGNRAPEEPPACTGDADCPADDHVEGCLAADPPKRPRGGGSK